MERAWKSRSWSAVAAVVAVLCLCAPAAAGASAPRLRVVENHLVDGRTGQVFVPRGVNWPSFEYACSDGFGYSNTASATNVGPDAAGAALIASWHINMVRVPLNQDCWLGDDGLPRFGTAAGYRAAVRAWVARLHRAGIAVMLDLHWSGTNGVVADGLRVMADDRSLEFWRSVASTFRRDRSMIFDAYNEPYSRSANGALVFDLTWGCWLNGGCNAPRAQLLQQPDGTTFPAVGMGALVGAIRSTGARQPIVLSGRGFANDLGEWLTHRPADRQLIAGFHNYNFQPCNNRSCWRRTIAPIARRVPVVAAEFGENDCRRTHVNRFMRFADRRGIGYLMWAWWVLPGTPCSTEVILAGVRGAPRAPNGTALKARLDALAPRVSLRGARRQALEGTVDVRVRCNKPCRARVGGRLRVDAGGAYRLSSGALRLGPRRARTVSLRLPRAGRRAALAALSGGRSVTAGLTVVATSNSLETRRVRRVTLGR